MKIEKVGGPVLYQLTVTEEELYVLGCVCGYLIGDVNGPRRVTDALYEALPKHITDATINPFSTSEVTLGSRLTNPFGD